MADMFHLTDDTVSVCFMTSGVSRLQIQRFPPIWFICRLRQTNVMVVKWLLKSSERFKWLKLPLLSFNNKHLLNLDGVKIKKNQNLPVILLAKLPLMSD